MASNPVPFAILALAQARQDELRNPPRRWKAVPRQRRKDTVTDVVVPAQVVRPAPVPGT